MNGTDQDPELVDTNVFVYAYDPFDERKRDLGRALFDRLSEEGRLAVSAQVLNEFYSRATRPNKPPSLTHDDARAAVRRIAAAALVLPLTLDACLRAIDAVANHQLALWDALIWAVAKENGISVIYTEDVPGQPVIEGVRYVNPFAAPAAPDGSGMP